MPLSDAIHAVDLHFIWLAIFVLTSFTTQAMSGFGSVIIAVTLGANFYPLAVLLPVIVPLDVTLNAYIIIKNHKAIDRPLLVRKIFPYMGAGLLVGVIVFSSLQGSPLKAIFGIFITLLCVRELVSLIWRRATPLTMPDFLSSLFIFAAGAVQGMFASGGPLLVYAVNRLKLEKSAFRSTLCALWFACNFALTVFYMASGRYSPEILKLYAMLVPFMIMGLFIGDKLHHRIDEHLFKLSVFVLLLFAGVSISYNSLVH